MPAPPPTGYVPVCLAEHDPSVGSRVGLDHRLALGARISGGVAETDGTPFFEVWVDIANPERAVRHVKAAANGSWTVAGLPAGTYRAWVGSRFPRSSRH